MDTTNLYTVLQRAPLKAVLALVTYNLAHTVEVVVMDEPHFHTPTVRAPKGKVS